MVGHSGDDEAPVGSEVRDKATDEKCERGLDTEIGLLSRSPCAFSVQVSARSAHTESMSVMESFLP
jgi:hypothetical protein